MTHKFNPKMVFEQKGHYIHRAAWVVCDARHIIENGCIETLDGSIINVFKGNDPQISQKKSVPVVDHGRGVLLPGLVNAHVHFELSALKDAVPYENGFRNWVKILLEKRAQINEHDLLNVARKQIRAVYESGTCLVGEISTLGITHEILEQSHLDGVWFHEFLGSEYQDIELFKNDKFLSSVAAHAPHTCSSELLTLFKKKSLKERRPFSIHLAESADETEFITQKKGEWADFLNSRGIDYSQWRLPSSSPVAYLYDIGILDQLTLAVHLLNVDENDIGMIAQSKTHVCLCCRSNKNLHSQLPDILAMLSKGIKPCLGTDSLASCDSLDVFHEMAFIYNNYPEISPQIIFEMATENGSKALGFDHLTGSLAPGKKAVFCYVDVHANNSKELLESIVSNDQ